MGIYRYQAVSLTSGDRRRGELTADSAYQVRLALRRMDLLPQSVRELRTQDQSRPWSRWLGERLSGRRRWLVIELYENLAALLASGTPLAQALDLLALAGGRSPTGTLCRRLNEEVRQGSGLADAMASHRLWFTPVDRALVAAAEQSGETIQALTSLAVHHSRSDALRTRLLGALAYPALLMTFGLGVVIFLTTTTLPQLADVLSDADVALPGPTKALLAFGHAVTTHWWWLLPVALTFIIALAVSLRTAAATRLLLKTPFLGSTMARATLADASRLLARLLEAGIPLTEALQLVRPAIANRTIRSAFETLETKLKQGESTADVLRATGVIDAVYCRVLEVGEESGELPATLKSIGERYALSARRRIDRLASMLEPTVILLLAAMIGFVVYAAIAPMLRLTQTL